MKRKLQEQSPTNFDDETLHQPKHIKAFESPSKIIVRPAVWAKPFQNSTPYKPVTKEEALHGKRVRVYADGVFDLFHYGHGRFLMQAKSLFPNVELVVGVSNDNMTCRLKGKTVMTEEERYDCISHCRYVDEILRDPPWIITIDFLNEYHLDFSAHDSEPYKSNGNVDIYDEVKKLGRFLPTTRAKEISTGNIIARIISGYDMYLKRTMLRGYTVKQLKVGFVKLQEIKFRNKVDSMSRTWRNMIMSFLELFGRDRRIIKLFSDQKRKLSVALLSQQIDSPIMKGCTVEGPGIGETASDEAFKGNNNEN